MGLQKFEGRLERLVDGTFSKAFRGSFIPLRSAAALPERWTSNGVWGSTDSFAPNAFGVRLATDDFERFESFLEALIRELEEAAREHARNENYVFVGPVTVTVYEDRRLRRGRFTVVSEFKEGPSGLAAASLVLAEGGRIVIGAETVTIGRLPESTVVLSTRTPAAATPRSGGWAMT